MFCHYLNNVSGPSSEPEGMSAPEVVPVDSSTVRVLWFPPLQPNGAITGYFIYLNNRLYGSVDNSSGSLLLRDLLPFTVYNVQVQRNHAHSDTDKVCTLRYSLVYWCDFQVEVCTVYACVRSDVTQTTTVEDLPAGLGAPHAQVISPR